MSPPFIRDRKQDPSEGRHLIKKHGASHGLAVLLCTAASALLVDVVRNHVPFLHDFFRKISVLVVEKLHLDHAPEYLHILIYAVFLATIWGIGFSFLHSDPPKRVRRQ